MKLHIYISLNNICIDDLSKQTGYNSRSILNSLLGHSSPSERFLISICTACKDQVSKEELLEEITENRTKTIRRIYPRKRN
jgi:hypothetical protein